LKHNTLRQAHHQLLPQAQQLDSVAMQFQKRRRIDLQFVRVQRAAQRLSLAAFKAIDHLLSEETWIGKLLLSDGNVDRFSFLQAIVLLLVKVQVRSHILWIVV